MSSILFFLAGMIFGATEIGQGLFVIALICLFICAFLALAGIGVIVAVPCVIAAVIVSTVREKFTKPEPPCRPIYVMEPDQKPGSNPCQGNINDHSS